MEEQLLRICGEVAGHRYLFGVLALGGLMTDYDRQTLEDAIEQADHALEQG